MEFKVLACITETKVVRVSLLSCKCDKENLIQIYRNYYKLISVFMFVCKFLCLYKMLGVGMIHKIEKKKES